MIELIGMKSCDDHLYFPFRHLNVKNRVLTLDLTKGVPLCDSFGLEREKNSA